MRILAATVAVLLLVTGCSGSDPEPGADPGRVVLNPPADDAGHTHAPGEQDPLPLGDGTSATAGGYRLDDVRLPRATGQPGELSFSILGPDGRPVTDYVAEQTKLLHLYVVRTDLAIYRHLHPTLEAGRWTAPIDLDRPGDYRMIADFVPGGTTRTVVLGASATVPGAWSPAPLSPGGDDGVVQVRVDGTGSVGDNGRLHLDVTTVDGEPVTLGSYLGATAHVSGFRVGTGDQPFVHLHPYGAPEQADDRTRLTFHTTFAAAGDYRLFVQVRVDGLLHTVPVTATVTRR